MVGTATGKPDDVSWVATEHLLDLSGIFEHWPCTAFDASKQRAQFVIVQIFDDYTDRNIWGQSFGVILTPAQLVENGVRFFGKRSVLFHNGWGRENLFSEFRE